MFQLITKKQKMMATPIRMAPVLSGKDAEYFYEVWQKSIEEPYPTYPDKEERERYETFIAKNRMKRWN